MAIIENRTTAEGDILIIKPEIPVVGLVSLYNFVDTTVGESLDDYYLKEFRYSIDGGLNFSDWIELTLSNIQAVSISKENQFVIEYRYTHVGSTPAVELEFQDILVSGNIENLPYPIYDTIYLKDFFEVNNINVYGWALNVLEKLYLKGILPEYVTRGEKTSDLLEDQDFISFWNTTTHFFALIVYWARQFRDISDNTELLASFLKDRSIQVGNATDEDILNLFSEYIEEYRKRGTLQIIAKKEDSSTFNGEFLRLFGFESPEEFIFALFRSSEIGWCIGKSSPCWNGTENATNLIKAYEYTKEVLDLSKYPLINSSYISIDGDEMLIESVPSGETAGIYQDGDDTKKIPVNKNLDYEVSFFCSLEQDSTEITFGIKGYDILGNSINLRSVVDGVVLNNFFTQETLKLPGTVYWIRGIIYNQDKSNDVSSIFTPNGINLRFDSETEIKYIVPNVLLDNTNNITPNGIRISGFRVRPLKTPFTRGQLGIKNLILSYLVNNSKEFSQTKLESIAKSSLISAQSFLKIKYL